jgi:FKBP-type peptidyl-prolyl cis-trans isomerase
MSKDNKTTLVVIGIILLIAVVLVFYFVLKPRETKAPTNNGAAIVNNINNQTAMDQVKIEILKQGEGAEAKAGDSLTVNYVGTLEDGTKFDSSIDRNEPFVFTLGVGQVIQGWDQGMAGMKVGEKRKLTIPASLGYGDRAVGPIPANSTLIFEVDLLKIN